MSKSNPGRLFGGRSGGTVTVIEAQVHRSSARNARMAFILTALVVGLLSAIVAADFTHPILAMLLGILLGVVFGAAVWAVVRIWPVLRLIWWWATEILLAVTLVYGWIALAANTTLVVRLAVVAVLVGVPAALGPIRRRIVALAWCVIVRHRLRVCFNQFIVANRSGSLPFILWARPTPVGERVWIWLRPGLSINELKTRLDKMAAACWAYNVVVDVASDRNAAYARVDIKRRRVLNSNVGNPLVDLVDPDDLGIPNTKKPAATATVGGMDLPDVADVPDNGRKPNPSRTKPTADAGTTPNGATTADDISDWI